MKAPTPKRLPRSIDSDGTYTAGLLAGRKWALRDAAPVDVSFANDAWHRGHTAGMYAALELLAEQLGINL